MYSNHFFKVSHKCQNYSLLKHFAQKRHLKNHGNETFIYVHAIKKKYSKHLLISVLSIVYCNQIDQIQSKLYKGIQKLTFIIVYRMF